MVQLPTPPERVVGMISPSPIAGPVRAIILLGVFHSAERIQSAPQMVKPEKQQRFQLDIILLLPTFYIG